jgi:hypothetical protein
MQFVVNECVFRYTPLVGVRRPGEQNESLMGRVIQIFGVGLEGT